MFYQVFVLPNSDFSDWDIMIMIALKGVIRDFLQSPHCTANCLQYIRSIVSLKSREFTFRHTCATDTKTCSHTCPTASQDLLTFCEG